MLRTIEKHLNPVLSTLLHFAPQVFLLLTRGFPRQPNFCLAVSLGVRLQIPSGTVGALGGLFAVLAVCSATQTTACAVTVDLLGSSPVAALRHCNKTLDSELEMQSLDALSLVIL